MENGRNTNKNQGCFQASEQKQKEAASTEMLASEFEKEHLVILVKLIIDYLQ